LNAPETRSGFGKYYIHIGQIPSLVGATKTLRQSHMEAKFLKNHCNVDICAPEDTRACLKMSADSGKERASLPPDSADATSPRDAYFRNSFSAKK
jgi:hypothetical protein